MAKCCSVWWSLFMVCMVCEWNHMVWASSIYGLWTKLYIAETSTWALQQSCSVDISWKSCWVSAPPPPPAFAALSCGGGAGDSCTPYLYSYIMLSFLDKIQWPLMALTIYAVRKTIGKWSTPPTWHTCQQSKKTTGKHGIKWSQTGASLLLCFSSISSSISISPWLTSKFYCTVHVCWNLLSSAQALKIVSVCCTVYTLDFYI